MKEKKLTAEELIEKRFKKKVESFDDTCSDKLISMLSHSSCRSFKNEILPRQTLDLLYYSAFSAPSKSDLQQCDIIEVSDPQILEKISKLTPSMKWIETAPLILIFCGNGERIRKICEMQGKKFNNEHIDSFVNSLVDTSLVMMNLINAANILKLGTCPISHIRNNAAEISSLLKVPDYNFILNGLALGYPNEDKKIKLRLPLEITVHKNVYEQKNLDQLLQLYDNNKIQNKEYTGKQRFSEKFPAQERYGWLEDKSRQFSVSERQDYSRYLKEQKVPLT